MDPPESADLDYLLSVGGAPAATSVPMVAPVSAGVSSVGASGAAAAPGAAPTATSNPAADDAPPASAATQPASKKRPLGQDDKKARERKRVLRNRELARVSNERRKGRIKAMESELNETRQTVATLEESIRCLEAENKELKNLLQGKNPAPAAPEQNQTQPQTQQTHVNNHPQ